MRRRRLAGTPRDARTSSIPSGEFVYTPRFTGAGRIVFDKGGNIWDIDANCGRGGTPCTMADARPLANASDGEQSAAWTASLAFAAAPQQQTGGSGTPTTQPPPAQPPPGQPGPRRPTRFWAAFPRPELHLPGRLLVPARAGYPGPRPRADRHRRRSAVAGDEAVRFRGRAGSNRFTVRKVGRRRLRPGRYVATITAVANGQRSPARRLAFRIKR